MTESLEALLIRVRGEEKALEGANEEAVRQTVINPILTHLGWNTENLHEVCPEFPIEGKKVDYCLKHQGCEQILIEAKKAGDNLEQREEQLLEYSFRRGVPIAVLTNGMEWWFYLPLKQGPWKERKFFAVDITVGIPGQGDSDFEVIPIKIPKLI
jgi:predicted type IV restriction endonuclease